MIRFYYHCFGLKPSDERFLADALKELAQCLRTEPTKLDITLIRLGDEPELEKKVNAELGPLSDDLMGNKFSIYSLTIKSVLEKTLKLTLPRLLVYCPGESHIAKVAIRSANIQSWGLTDDFFAAVYKQGNKWIIWHEALHTLGADECYDKKTLKPKPNCTLGPSCVMQYVHTNPKKTLAKWPFLCKENVRLLQEFRDKVNP